MANDFDPHAADSTASPAPFLADSTDQREKASIAELVPKYGSSSATAWLEFERYKIWRPDTDIAPSAFRPVQGYMRRDPYVFAWGNPLVSDPAALEPTAKAFIQWVEAQNLRPIWACVDHDMEEVLGGEAIGWCTVNCIYEDVVDPAHVMEVTSEDAEFDGGVPSHLKDLKKNLRRAEKANVDVKQIKDGQWSDQDKLDIETGIEEWRKSRSGLQLASTSLQPWLDQEHRRYWVAYKDNKAVGILILTPVKGNQFQIKNAISFPDAPKGTSEAIIHGALKDLHEEQGSSEGPNDDRVTVTFGITASDKFKAVQNLSGWRVSALAKTYGKVAKGAGLLRRGDFRVCRHCALSSVGTKQETDADVFCAE
ncbi:hypothetical protein HGRIS_011808 [Hohenbuehelia grisea]|uniref:Phosphatidylglycerol lysyltransferase C-terminal domain-containing protein n=1 Tax=Hohenbuehelia grisea TaxID=104357 RepID=A0ABR3JX42_9AGAR